MYYIVQILTNSEADQPTTLIGPFDSHQVANGHMQEMYDLQLVDPEEMGVVDSDESEASHFYIEFADDYCIDWYIVTPTTPEEI